MSDTHLGFTRVVFVATLFLLTAVVAISFAADGPPSVSVNKLPVILDTDIGDDIDDTWALVMLLKSPQFDVKLITTTCGKNVYRSKIIAKLLTVAGRTDIPIGMGAGGSDGVGGQQPWVEDFDLARYKGKVIKDGVGAMIDTINAAASPVTIISIGPSHTVAAALGRQPGIAAKARFVGMQGSVRKGYDGGKPCPEWNIKVDVPAAQKALSAPWREAIITPLDTCGLIKLSGKRFQKLTTSKDPLVKAMIESYRIWAKDEKVAASTILFDTVAIYLALPGPKPLLKMEDLRIKVTADGMTPIDPTGAKMAVATEWKDLEAYRDLLVRILLSQGEAVKSVRLVLPPQPGLVVEKVGRVFVRQVQSRCGAKVVCEGKAPLVVELAVECGIGGEGFKITDEADGAIRITGNDARGLLYGVGKFLHTAAYGNDGFTPGSWRGTSVPKMPVRGIYFATHFHNYYQVAPIEEVTRYVEDLSLWGPNSLLVWFGMEEFNGINDPKAQAMLERLRALLKIVKDLGLNASLGCICNEGYANSPVSLRADDSTVNHPGYHADVTGGNRITNLGPELCPSKPGVTEMELGYCKEKFDAFKDIGLDYWCIWPYDSGGCTCSKCAPWGANAYLRMAEPVARAYRRAFRNGKVILSTWYFDRWAVGEWDGITAKFKAKKPDWVDYILADNFEDYPRYPLDKGVPGSLPLLNFP
ncbi:MAG: nucleoside hydrolase [Thermoguttaceae bacterium]